MQVSSEHGCAIITVSFLYVIKFWYVYLTFEKYNTNETFLIVVYFLSAIRIIWLFNYPI